MTGIYPYRGKRPAIAADAWIAPTACLIGDVTVESGASVWFNATLRGDMAAIRIGPRTSVQDNVVVHTEQDGPTIVGADCTVGHGAIVHACRIGHGSLIGMGAIVLTRAVIGDESLVAAGAVVPERREFPPRSLLLGAPARVVRTLLDEDVERLIRPGLGKYRRYVEGYRQTGLGQPSIGVSHER